MAADYVKLAEEYKDSKNVLIAEIDATAYKIPIVEVKGFPTLVLFKKGNVRVKQVKFSGKRSA